jgi:hypothetical protein
MTDAAEWTGQQLREAFPFDQLPRYLLRDRDAIFGDAFRGQVCIPSTLVTLAWSKA